jgi:hypothetical protein
MKGKMGTEDKMRRARVGPRIALDGFMLACLILMPCAGAGEKPLADIYKTGKVKFIPEITITEEALGGKDFFGGLSDVAVDDNGFLYVCDYKNRNIKKFGATGVYLKSIGRLGQGPGEFNSPMEIEVANGKLYVMDLMNMRISIFDFEGKFLKSVPILPEAVIQAGSWWKMKALPDGRFIVHKEKVDRNDLKAPQEVFLNLYSSELDFIKTIYQQKIRRDKYITEPRKINVPIPFAAQVYWDIMPDGKLAVGFSEKYEIEIYDPDKGKVSSFSHEYTPVEVTALDKELHFKGMSVTIGGPSGIISETRGAPDYVVKNTEFPRYKPPFYELAVDAQGNIWIRPFLADPKMGPCFDAFAPNGAFLNRVRIEGGAHFPYRTAWLARGFWTCEVDKEGEYKIVKYKISE